MTKTIVVCGYGSGISHAVAQRFGAEGFGVALVARNEERLREAVVGLTASGVRCAAFPCDLGVAADVKNMIASVHEQLGPITVVHWNAYVFGGGDLMQADVAELQKSFDVSVTGLVAAAQASHADLRDAKDGAILVTGGGFAFYDPAIDKMAAEWSVMGLAVAKAAQHKLTGVLHAKLANDGIFVGEVVVTGMVKGTVFDRGGPSIEPSRIADALFGAYRARDTASVSVGA